MLNLFYTETARGLLSFRAKNVRHSARGQNMQIRSSDVIRFADLSITYIETKRRIALAECRFNSRYPA